MPALDNSLAPDAFVNREHLKFALRGCLAASSCYMIYNSIGWSSIGAPAIATCLLTAVSAVGASRQRQVLRFAAFIVGGLLIGIGSGDICSAACRFDWRIHSLFHTCLVTLVCRPWFMTSSPRLSYFGFQIAVIFCLINFQEFARQTSLRAAARDRIVGVGLGLCMMWLVFDRLWSVHPVALEMETSIYFQSAVRTCPTRSCTRTGFRKIQKSYVARSNSLRDRSTNRSFDQVRALADALSIRVRPFAAAGPCIA